MHFRLYQVCVCSVNEKILLSLSCLVEFTSCAHRCFHARREAIVGVKVVLHGTIHSFFLLDETSVWVAILGVSVGSGDRCPQIRLELCLGGVMSKV